MMAEEKGFADAHGWKGRTQGSFLAGRVHEHEVMASDGPWPSVPDPNSLGSSSCPRKEISVREWSSENNRSLAHKELAHDAIHYLLESTHFRVRLLDLFIEDFQVCSLLRTSEV